MMLWLAVTALALAGPAPPRPPPRPTIEQMAYAKAYM
jgi:hypothetical protein